MSVRDDFPVELRGFEPQTSAVQAPARLTGSSLPFLVGDVDHLRRRLFIRPAFEGVTSTIGRPCLVTRSRQAIASSGSFRTVRISSFGRRNDGIVHLAVLLLITYLTVGLGSIDSMA